MSGMNGIYVPGLYKVGSIVLGKNKFEDSQVGVYRKRDVFFRKNLNCIGIFGSVFDDYDPEVLKMDVDKNRCMAETIGKEITKRKSILVNGACMGFPHDAAMAAAGEGGYVIGFSPEGSEDRHIEVGNSIDAHDVIFYPGIDISPKRNFIERDALNVYSAKDGIIVIGGSYGTNHEVAIAAELGITVAFLKGSGGVADSGKEYYEGIRKKPWPKFIEDTDPVALVERLYEEIERIKPLIQESARKRGRKKTDVLEMIVKQTEPYFLAA